MTVREAINLLLNNGFIELNQVGSHRKFGKEKYRITIVFHRSLKEEIHPKLKKQIERLCDKGLQIK